MFLQRVVNLFGSFERFLKHAFTVLYLNVLWPDDVYTFGTNFGDS